MASIEKVKHVKYDAIIVGGGTAGLVAAARLSEDPSKKILVIEAGADRRGDVQIDVPGMLMSTWGNPTYDWDFWSTPQEHLGGREIPQPRGKVLGGSSAINVTALAYPTRRNFEAWTDLGNEGWSFDDLAPYYKKFHTFYPASKETSEFLSLDAYIDPKNQGSSGPLAASFSDVYTPFNKAWVESFNSAGFEDTNDPILGNKLGPFSPPNSLDPKTKQRSYSASAYYTSEIEKRPNLDLLTETFVNKALLEKSGNEYIAKGVQIKDKEGKTTDIFANEVILAAGTMQSPVILENSGIGSKDVLKQNGIEVLIDNPAVGENLQDHAFTTISFQIADDQISGDIARDPAVVELLTKQYFESKSGPLSGIAFSLAYMPPVDIKGRMLPEDVKALTSKLIDANDPKLSPGMKQQYAHLKSLVEDPKESTCYYGILLSQMHVKPEGKTSMSEAYSSPLPQNYITIMVGLNHPLSRGSIHSNKYQPVINPSYLSHPLDLEILSRGTQFIDTLVSQPSFSALLQSSNRIPALATQISDLGAAKQVTKDRLWTTFHPVGTAAMLPRELGGVVDPRLVVYGTKGLRVIDASVFPLITLGNIQATVYAVAEKACDIIKEDWKKSEMRLPVKVGSDEKEVGWGSTLYSSFMRIVRKWFGES